MSTALTIRIKVKDNEGRVIDEKEVATYAGVLAKAHEEGLKSITTRLVQIPHEDNGCNAIVEATVVTEKGSFAGIGDAAPHNVGRKIVPHIIRMAETRAKARALRDAVNIGIVSLDELGGDDFEATAPAPAPAPAPRRGDRPPLHEVPRPDERRGPAPAEARRPPPSRMGSADRAGASTGGHVPDLDERVRADLQRSPIPANSAVSRMTENQRRWLYRYLMVDRRFKEDEVPAVLCRAAQVDAIEQITKADASALIDEWKKDTANA